MSRLDAFRAMTAADVIECLAEDPSVLGVWQGEIVDLQLASEKVEAAEAWARVAEKERAEMRALLDPLTAEVARLTAAKDGAYTERNLCVALIARLADEMVIEYDGYAAWLGEHDPADTAWERDWLNIVFVQIPTGQLSWHIHDSELPLFDFLPRMAHSEPGTFAPYDGHTTEQKYDRIRAALKAGGLGGVDVP